jgi:hypothetical protein
MGTLSHGLGLYGLVLAAFVLGPVGWAIAMVVVLRARRNATVNDVGRELTDFVRARRRRGRSG